MTARKAIEKVRRKIKDRLGYDMQMADAHHRAGRYESEQSYLSRVSALSEALCCVGDVEREAGL